MKLLSALFLLAISAGTLWAAKKAPAVNNSDRGPCPVTHRFLKGGWKSKGVGIVPKDLTMEWEQPDGSEISDAWHLADGSVVHSFSERRECRRDQMLRPGQDARVDLQRRLPDATTIPANRCPAGDSSPANQPRAPRSWSRSIAAARK